MDYASQYFDLWWLVPVLRLFRGWGVFSKKNRVDDSFFWETGPQQNSVSQFLVSSNATLTNTSIIVIFSLSTPSKNVACIIVGQPTRISQIISSFNTVSLARQPSFVIWGMQYINVLWNVVAAQWCWAVCKACIDYHTFAPKFVRLNRGSLLLEEYFEWLCFQYCPVTKGISFSFAIGRRGGGSFGGCNFTNFFFILAL